MSTNNIPGSFGSNTHRENTEINLNNRNFGPQSNIKSDRLADISSERLVDIVCCSIIAIFFIVVICTWGNFSELLFQSILFPVICVGSKILALVSAIGVGIGALCLKFRRRRFW